MTQSDVIDLVRAEVARAGSMRKLARQWSMSPPYLSDVLNGYRPPGPRIIFNLGLQRHVDYRKISQNGKKPS
jgi:hypothetical protein